MKKILLLAGLLSIILTPSISFAATSNSAQTEKATTAQKVKNFEGNRPRPHQFDKKRQEEFQKKLGLTDEQKAKAKTIHEKGRAEMQPVMEKMKAKHEKIKAIKEDSTLNEEAKRTQIEEQVKQLHTLKQYANELRMKNMKEFESILTKDQQKTLKEMKKEGRKNFDKQFKKAHPQRPMFGQPPFGERIDHPYPIKPIEESK